MRKYALCGKIVRGLDECLRDVFNNLTNVDNTNSYPICLNLIDVVSLDDFTKRQAVGCSLLPLRYGKRIP